MPRRCAVLLLAGAILLATGCADPSPSGSPPPENPQQLVSPGFPPPEGLVPEDGLAPGELGVDPMPYEQFTFTERLFTLAGESADFGGVDATNGEVLVVRWFGDLPAELRALIAEYADAPFDIRVEPTQFPPGDLRAEAERLVRDHPGVVTAAFPRNEGDGVGVGIDPSVASSPGADDLERLGIRSPLPLFPEALGQPVPAGG